jgi:hypothetical protein
VSALSPFANYLLSLPPREAALRKQAAKLLGEADGIVTILQNLDRTKLDSLTLTGSTKLDAALRLSMESGRGGKDWLEKFPQILERLTIAEQEIAAWKAGGLMLADLTPQVDRPLCLEFAVVAVPARPTLQITPVIDSFSIIPFSVWVPGYRLMTASSATAPIGITHHKNDVSGGIDLTKLFHPNWGPWHVPLANIFLGNEAIVEHIEDWKESIAGEYRTDPASRTHYAEFLEKFREAFEALARA